MTIELVCQVCFLEACIAISKSASELLLRVLLDALSVGTYSDNFDVSANSVRSLLSRLLRYDVVDMSATWFYFMRQLGSADIELSIGLFLLAQLEMLERCALMMREAGAFRLGEMESGSISHAKAISCFECHFGTIVNTRTTASRFVRHHFVCD